MACGGCAKRRAERAALREQKLQERAEARKALAEQQALTASAQQQQQK